MALKSGDVVSNYPYLWLRQYEAGETEGRKDKSGRNHLVLLPISSQKPGKGQAAIKLPATERKGIGLDSFRDAWIYLDEYNYDIEEKSYYLAKNVRITRSVSSRFRKRLAVTFGLHMGKDAKRVDRV
jgi:hypothetical protein